ncbi:hypothetical protein T484DRAFT_3155974 [Baffinella frigidus]|nr:hypothetical protein T484DRAFT_3155974 [Cryptophyta sp. CCMP2293]
MDTRHPVTAPCDLHLHLVAVLNPKPKTQNPKPETRNPKPETQTPNPKPQTPNPEPRSPNQTERGGVWGMSAKALALAGQDVCFIADPIPDKRSVRDESQRRDQDKDEGRQAGSAGSHGEPKDDIKPDRERSWGRDDADDDMSSHTGDLGMVVAGKDAFGWLQNWSSEQAHWMLSLIYKPVVHPPP